MQIKALFLFGLLFCLSACGHLNKAPTITETPTQVKHQSNELPSNPEITTEQVDDITQVDPENTPQAIDLLERLRQGFAFPTLTSPLTKNHQKWSLQHSSYLTNLLERAEPFLYYIVEEIEKRGLPTELALLPAIESAYKPNAISKSRAAGLWQFIPSTGKSFGLRQDWWYDGRRDAIRSTNAALDYLTQLNKTFDGDWFLTLAAYNAGQGTISRAIRKNKHKHREIDYQSLKLRVETQHYIPKLQALKNIIAHPERYGVTLRSIPNQPHFEVIKLPGQVDLQKFSDQSGIGINKLRHLNAGFLRWATSPDGPHRLLTPLANHEQTILALQTLKDAPLIGYQRHIIAQGETLSEIGQRYGVSVNALRENNHLRGSSIRAGKTLMIPIAQGATPIASASQITTQRTHIHHVAKGETLWSISRRYHVKVKELLDWNQLQANQILKLNQALLILKN